MRKTVMRAIAAVVFTSLGVMAFGTSAGATPTCAGVGALQTHGQHIVGDYVTGLGGISGGMAWPPKGGVVGETIAGEGAALPGQSGIHNHAPFAPGASFCTDSNSPGIHLE